MPITMESLLAPGGVASGLGRAISRLGELNVDIETLRAQRRAAETAAKVKAAQEAEDLRRYNQDRADKLKYQTQQQTNVEQNRIDQQAREDQKRTDEAKKQADAAARKKIEDAQAGLGLAASHPEIFGLTTGTGKNTSATPRQSTQSAESRDAALVSKAMSATDDLLKNDIVFSLKPPEEQAAERENRINSYIDTHNKVLAAVSLQRIADANHLDLSVPAQRKTAETILQTRTSQMWEGARSAPGVSPETQAIMRAAFQHAFGSALDQPGTPATSTAVTSTGDSLTVPANASDEEIRDAAKSKELNDQLVAVRKEMSDTARANAQLTTQIAAANNAQAQIRNTLNSVQTSPRHTNETPEQLAALTATSKELRGLGLDPALATWYENYAPAPDLRVSKLQAELAAVGDGPLAQVQRNQIQAQINQASAPSRESLANALGVPLPNEDPKVAQVRRRAQAVGDAARKILPSDTGQNVDTNGARRAVFNHLASALVSGTEDPKTVRDAVNRLTLAGYGQAVRSLLTSFRE